MDGEPYFSSYGLELSYRRYLEIREEETCLKSKRPKNTGATSVHVNGVSQKSRTNAKSKKTVVNAK
jgi:hypothetical protein